MSTGGAAQASRAPGARRGASAEPLHSGPPDGRRVRDARVIGEVGLAHACSHFFQLSLPPLFPAFRDTFGLSWSELGLLMTVFYAVSCVGQAAAGFLVDAQGPRRVLAAAFAAMVAGAIAAATASGSAGLFAAAALMALGNSAFHPADFSTLNRCVSPSRLGHAFSLHAVAGNVGYASAPVAMIAMSGAFGWRGALVGAAVLGVGTALFVLRPAGVFGSVADERPAGRVASTGAGTTAGASAALRTTPATGPTLSTQGALAFLNPALLACMVFFVTINIAMIGLQSFGATLLQAAYGYPVATSAAWLTAFIVAAGAGMLAGGFVAAATPRHEWVAAAGTIAAGLVSALLAVQVVPEGLAGPLACAAGFAIGVVAPSRDMLVRASTPVGATGRAYGIVYSGVDVGAALGPLFVGAWLDRAMPGAAYATVAVALFITAGVGLAIALLARRLPSSAAPAQT